MNLNKLALPVSIIIGAFVLGGFYYAVQSDKQESIERQQSLELLDRMANADKDKEIELYKLRSPKCEELGEAFMEDIENTDPDDRYTYSASDDKCIYEYMVSYMSYDDGIGTSHNSYEMYDLFTGADIDWLSYTYEYFGTGLDGGGCLKKDELEAYNKHRIKYFDDELRVGVCTDSNE
jgi:nitrogen fixation-related uncharacterized protein